MRTLVSTNARYLAVVPAYNEAETVPAVIESIRESTPYFDVLVVDDGSTDGTGDLAEHAGVAVLRHPFNPGIGGAMQAGFEYARREGYDYMVQIDGSRIATVRPDRPARGAPGWLRPSAPTSRQQARASSSEHSRKGAAPSA